MRTSALHSPAALGGRPGGRSAFVGAVSADLFLRRPRSGGLQLRQCPAAGGGRHLLSPAVHDRLRRAERRAESAVSGGYPSGCGRRGHCHLRLSAPLRGAGDGPPVYLPGAVPSGAAEDPAVSGPDGPDAAAGLLCRAAGRSLLRLKRDDPVCHQLLRLRGHGGQLRRLRH